MAQSPLSMFDVQPQLSYADQARQQQQAAMQYAQLSGPQQSSYNMFQTAAGMAPPVADLARVGIAAAQGQPVDNPQAKLQNIRAKVQDALRGVDATDPTKVYPTMIQVLQQEGMVSQAMALQKEYEDVMNKRRDDERAQKKDLALADYHQKLIDSRDPRSPLSKSIDAYQALVAKRDALPEDSPARAALDKGVKAYEEQLLKQHKVILQDTPDATFVLDPTTGNEIRRFSHTMRPTGGSINGGARQYDDETLRKMAQQYISGDRGVAQGFGRSTNNPDRARFNQLVYAEAEARGMDPAAVAQSLAEFGGIQQEQRTVGARAGQLGIAGNAAYTMGDLVAQTSADVSRTKFTPVNTALLAYQSNTGDPAVVKYGAALNSFINAYARAINPTGQATVSDKEHARDMLNRASSHEQVVATINQLKAEIDAEKAAIGRTRTDMRETNAGRPGAQSPAAAPTGKPTMRFNPSTGKLEPM